jgi:hypothetical protein
MSRIEEFDDFKEKFKKMGITIDGDTPEEFNEILNKELKKSFGKYLNNKYLKNKEFADDSQRIKESTSPNIVEEFAEEIKEPQYEIISVNKSKGSMRIKYIIINGNIKCPCGSVIVSNGLNKHKKSKKHREWHNKFIAEYSASDDSESENDSEN